MNRIMPLVKLADSKAMKEQTGLVKSLRGSESDHSTPTSTYPPSQMTVTLDANSTKSDLTSSFATLILALLPLVVEVT